MLRNGRGKKSEIDNEKEKLEGWKKTRSSNTNIRFKKYKHALLLIMKYLSVF